MSDPIVLGFPFSIDRLLRHIREYRVSAAEGDDRHLREEGADRTNGAIGTQRQHDQDHGHEPPSDEKVVAHALPKIEVALQVMERQLSHGQGFLLGGEVSLADYYLLPSTYSFGRTPEGKAAYADAPVVQAWRERMEALPTVQRFRATHPNPWPPIEHARKWAISHRPKY
jgi:glutathione S-transferase